MSRESMSEQLSRLVLSKTRADNDNKPQKTPKKPETRYRGTLPALRWLYENHPDLAHPVAQAIRDLAVINWDSDAVDNSQEIRPTIGEIIRSATNEETGEWLYPTIGTDSNGGAFTQIGNLKFVKGELVEYGRTRKGRKLKPRDRTAQRAADKTPQRNVSAYVFHVRPTTPSPLHAEPYHRPFSGERALPPMYDPQKGVAAARAVLQSFGVDGAVPFERLPFPATRCPTKIAKGAEFLGGIAQPSGNSSSGAVNIGELPEAPKGEVMRIVEEIASGATLKDIGERLGPMVVRVDRVAKRLIVDAAKVLSAANNNEIKKIAA